MSLWPEVVGGVAAGTSGVVAARVLAGRWFKKMMTIARSLHWIADNLDTDTPGGMTDLVKEVAALRTEVERQRQPQSMTFD